MRRGAGCDGKAGNAPDARCRCRPGYSPSGAIRGRGIAMKQLIRVGVAAVLLAASSASADVDAQIEEAAELARGVDSDSRAIMVKIPRACKILRGAARDIQAAADEAAAAAEEAGTEAPAAPADAARIDAALEHCRRAVTAVRNGHPQRAGYRVQRMIAALGVEQAPE